MKKDYIQTGRINQKLETRHKILESAKQLVRKGIDFNLEDVANNAEISRATIYRYYPNLEILSYEVGIDIGTKTPEDIIEDLKDCSLNDMLMGIQNYYNEHAVNNENAFRKYLSAVLTSASEKKRGARRNRTLQLALMKSDIRPKEKKDLVHLLAILMGIEPLIVAKDVSGLDNQEFKELMNWGMKLVLKGFFDGKETK
ncbi:DNA-binding transcriptional regulator, AcrR family [Arenibacter palladensis]|uniref:DNA-binding transcriptional regulator, AcrR family n=1 Tax=Arenibacter palladensis TaxID=237373 RepID=A0A1M4XBC8_9FLAO|nr:TetR/AcrR family transcriptional regulator [Arenibacter palladensis]SHE90715.1 DNA-binding transcriptional regulator, AcrR family [Arenibacter palladensis]